MFFVWAMNGSFWYEIGGRCYEHSINVRPPHDLARNITLISLAIGILITIFYKKLSKLYFILMIVVALFAFLIPIGMHIYAESVYNDSIKGQKPLPVHMSDKCHSEDIF